MTLIYQAGPLFTEAERDWHRKLRSKIQDACPCATVLWPGDFFPQEQIAIWGAEAPRRIFEVCRDQLATADLVVALLDGTQVDDGTAWEIGYAYANGIRVVGIRTDLRRAGETDKSLVNAMIEGTCEQLFVSADELIAWLGQELGDGRKT